MLLMILVHRKSLDGLAKSLSIEVPRNREKQSRPSFVPGELNVFPSYFRENSICGFESPPFKQQLGRPSSVELLSNAATHLQTPVRGEPHGTGDKTGGVK